MADFLFEVGLEEVPARMIPAAQAELARRVEDVLVNARLLERGSTRSYSTPRRLSVLVSDVRDRQPETVEQLTGPSWKVGFKDDQPTSAAIAFAKKAGVEIARMEKLTTAKGEYVAVTVQRPGRSATEILVEQLPRELTSLYWPKNMYWRTGKPERFVRPLRWLLALLDDEIVPVEFAGITASNVTYGHRILHGDAPIAIATPADYLTALESAYVLADAEVRRHKIRKALDAVTRTIPGAKWREDPELIDTVTHLTEWPSVIPGNFEAEYLTLPEEVLVTVMRDHQKYFAVEDSSGKLAPHFLAVLNTETDAAGQAIIRHGNERVLRARFNDARFFWNVDQRVPLIDRLEMLKSVTFHKDLGSYFDKTEANLRVTRSLAHLAIEGGAAIDEQALLDAVRLAKTDLTAELVKEFTELQGIVGGLYARAQGFSEATSQAMYWQYRPASSDDAIPPTVEGQILGLADRINTIVDMFALGLQPTGSKDPFALRRAANGVVKILAESSLPITLLHLRQAAIESSAQIASTSDESLRDFFRERVQFYLREVGGFAYDVVNATLAAGADDVSDAMARAAALTAVRDSADFVAISTAFKRMKNILKQAADNGMAASTSSSPDLFRDDAERVLYSALEKLAPQVELLRKAGNYREALELIATLRPDVDLFFDQVMVLTPEVDLRANRLSLIASVLDSFTRTADFSEIVTA